MQVLFKRPYDDDNKLVWPTWAVGILSDDDVDDDDNDNDKPVWPSWAVDVLFDEDDDTGALTIIRSEHNNNSKR